MADDKTAGGNAADARYYAERKAAAMAAGSDRAKQHLSSGSGDTSGMRFLQADPENEEAGSGVQIQAHDNEPLFPADSIRQAFAGAGRPSSAGAPHPEIFRREALKDTPDHGIASAPVVPPLVPGPGEDYYMTRTAGQFAGLVEASRAVDPGGDSVAALPQREIFRPEPEHVPSYTLETGIPGPAQGPAAIPEADNRPGNEMPRYHAADSEMSDRGPSYTPVPEVPKPQEVFHPELRQQMPDHGDGNMPTVLPQPLSAPGEDYYMTRPAGQFSGLVEASRAVDPGGDSVAALPQREIFRPEPEHVSSYTSEIGTPGPAQGPAAIQEAGYRPGNEMPRYHAADSEMSDWGPSYTPVPEVPKPKEIFHPEPEQVIQGPGTGGKVSSLQPAPGMGEDYYMTLPAGRFSDLVEAAREAKPQTSGDPEVHDNAYYMSQKTKYAVPAKPEHDNDYYMRQNSPGVRKYRAMHERDMASLNTDRFASGSLGSEVAAYNSYVTSGQKIGQVKGRLTHAASLGTGLIRQGVSDRDEEGHAVEDAAENIHVVRFAGGSLLDNTEMSDIVERNMLRVNRQVKAGNIFKSDFYKDKDIFKPEAFPGARIVDLKKVTSHDLEIFTIAEKIGPENLNDSIINRQKIYKKKSRLRRDEIESIVLSSEINSFEEFVRMLDKENPTFFTEAEKLVLEREDALLIARNPLDFEKNSQIIKKVLSDPRFVGEFADVDLDALGTKELKNLVRRRKKGVLGRGKNILLDIEKNPLFAAGIKALYQNQISLEAANRVQARRLARAAQVRRWTKGRVFRLLDNDADFAAMHAGVSSEMSVLRAGVTLSGDVVKVGSMAGYGAGSLINAGVASGLDMVGADGAARAVRGAGKTVNAGLDITKKTIRNITSLPGNTVRRTGQAVGTAAGKTAGAAAVRISTTVTETAAFRAVASNPAVKFISSRAFHVRLFIKRKISAIENIIRYPSRFLRRVFGVGGKGMRIAAGIIGGLILLECVFVLLFSGNAAPSSVISLILSNEDQFADYQKKYDQMDEAFTSQVSAIANGFAKTKDYSGATIHYGINRPVQNLQGYSNTAEPVLKAYDLPEEFHNGIHLAYLYNGSSASGLSSNIKDCVAAMAVIMGQDQSAHHSEALDLLGALYQSTHSYIATETPLYYCSHGDRLLHYFCNEKAQNYPSSPLMANTQVKKFEEPFDPEKSGAVCSIHQKEHPDDMKMFAGCQKVDSPEDYSDVRADEYETIHDTYDTSSATDIPYTYKQGIENANPAINSTGSTGKKLCFHNGGYGEKVADYDYVKERSTADFQQEASKTKLNAVFDAIKNHDEDALEWYYENDYWDVSYPEWATECDNLGYYYYYDRTGNLDHDVIKTGIRGLVVYCKGHDHYGCETGHDIPVCYGHTDLNMTIAINGIEKIFELGGVPVSGDNADVDADLLAGAKKKDSAEVASTEAADEDGEEDVFVRYGDEEDEEDETEEEDED